PGAARQAGPGSVPGRGRAAWRGSASGHGGRGQRVGPAGRPASRGPGHRLVFRGGRAGGGGGGGGRTRVRGRSAWSRSGGGRILVGVPGSVGSLQALRFATEEARKREARLIPVIAWVPPGGDLAERRQPVYSLRQIWRDAG